MSRNNTKGTYQTKHAPDSHPSSSYGTCGTKRKRSQQEPTQYEADDAQRTAKRRKVAPPHGMSINIQERVDALCACVEEEITRKYASNVQHAEEQRAALQQTVDTLRAQLAKIQAQHAREKKDLETALLKDRARLKELQAKLSEKRRV